MIQSKCGLTHSFYLVHHRLCLKRDPSSMENSLPSRVRRGKAKDGRIGWVILGFQYLGSPSFFISGFCICMK